MKTDQPQDEVDENVEIRAAIEEIDFDEFDELFEDFQDEYNVPDICQDHIDYQLVPWICSFLSFWQYVFSITDRVLLMLLKFLKIF